MGVTSAIAFVQGVSSSTPGEALMGVAGTVVTASNGNDTGVSTYAWSVLDSPPGSTVTVGAIGTTPTVTFTPDIPGGYLVQLVVVGGDGSTATDVRCFGVPQASGRFIPPFGGDASSLNFSNGTLGWDPFMRAWLLFLDGLDGGGGWTFVSTTFASHATPSRAAMLWIDENSSGGSYTQGWPTAPNANDMLAIHDAGATSATTGIFVNPITQSGGSINIQDPQTMTIAGTTINFGTPNQGGGATLYYKYNGASWARVG